MQQMLCLIFKEGELHRELVYVIIEFSYEYYFLNKYIGAPYFGKALSEKKSYFDSHSL